jgi:hypothetical protein
MVRAMTPGEWKKINDQVTDAMLAHTRPYVTPLGTETDRLVRLVGTGSYVQHEARRILLTCEHVAREQPMHHRFHGCDDVFRHPGPWTMDKHPIDAAFAAIEDPVRRASVHQADAIPLSRFAQWHRLSQPEEMLFFRGYAGENAHYAFGVHQTNGSGYCTQEKIDTGDHAIFELFWEPENTQVTAGTSAEAKAEMRWEVPRGFSGSLVWNTRYLEVTGQGEDWSPEDAVVTGLLRRWDEDARTLLVWRVEHLRTWLNLKGV